MDRLPLSIYDFFGYLASGFLIVVTIDFVRGGNLLSADLTTAQVIFWILLAYIAGQILASPSSWLLERTLVFRWLAPPSDILLRSRQPVSRLKRWLFPGYYVPLPEAIIERVISKSKIVSEDQSHGKVRYESLFIYAFSAVQSNEQARYRLDRFLALYGFCRNISFAAFVSSLVLLLTGAPTWGLLALGVAIGMFYRYLKFFRRYSWEVFVTYQAEERKKEADNEDRNT